MGEVDAAIGAYQEGVDRNPQYSLNLVTLAAALAFAGRMQEAREAIASVRRMAPGYSCEDYEKLARRMVYWFGECPARDGMLAAMRRAWKGVSTPAQVGGA